MERINIEHIDPRHKLDLIYLTHIKSYWVLRNFVKDKAVLDYGCGEGYGAHMLARTAQKVVGFDISPDCVLEARKKYAAPNLEFLTIEPNNGKDNDLLDNQYDVITSFQVIEHIADIQNYLDSIKKLLKESGFFFLTTPNASTRLLPFQNPWNQFHVREYTRKSLRKLLSQHFEHVKIFYIASSRRLETLENRRICLYKWLLWPVTNIFVPEAVRSGTLSLIKRILGMDKNSNPARKDTLDFTGDLRLLMEDIHLTETAAGPCHNLFAVCMKNTHQDIMDIVTSD